MTQPTKTIIAAVSRNGVIGRKGELPWKLSTDLKRFRQLTLGKPVIMGRKTYQSIGKPLVGRQNIIVSRDSDLSKSRRDTRTGVLEKGIYITHSFDEAVSLASSLASKSNVNEICIIGGGEIYQQAIKIADQMLLTHIEADVEGDTYFPNINPNIWKVSSETFVPSGEKDSYPTRFVSYYKA